MNYLEYIQHERPSFDSCEPWPIDAIGFAIAVNKQLGSVRWFEKNRYFLTNFYLLPDYCVG